MHDEVALRWMAREHLRDLTLTHLHPALKRWSSNPPPKMRSIRNLAKLAAERADGYSQGSDSERLRKKFETHKKRYLEEERYGDDTEETFDAQALANLKKPLKRIGIALNLPSHVERVKQQVAPGQQITDWLDIEQRFRLLRAGLEPMHLPTQDERRAYELYKEDPFQWGAWTYPGSKERQDRIQEFNKDVSELEADLAIVRKAIDVRVISSDFLLSWGHLNMVIGRQIELVEQEDRAKKDFERGRAAGKTQRRHEQRRWVACRLMDATKNDKSKLRKAKNDLRVVIHDIENKKRKPPPGYARNVSSRIVERISWSEIKKLAQAWPG